MGHGFIVVGLHCSLACKIYIGGIAFETMKQLKHLFAVF
jgi:hypothetical protein